MSNPIEVVRTIVRMFQHSGIAVPGEPSDAEEALSHITELVEGAKKALLALRQQAGSERWGTQAAVATWLGIVADGLDTALQPFTGENDE